MSTPALPPQVAEMDALFLRERNPSLKAGFYGKVTWTFEVEDGIPKNPHLVIDRGFKLTPLPKKR